MHRSGRYASLREVLLGAWCPSVSGSFGYSLPDLSGYGNHGALTNMDPPNDWVTSGGRMALDFDGTNDYVQAPAPLISQITTDASISIWSKLNATGVQGDLFSVGTSVSDASRFVAAVPWSDNTIYFDYGGQTGNNRLIISGQSWNTTTWDHFVFGSSRNGLFCYRNGVLIGSTSVGVSRQASSALLDIGRFDTAGGPYYYNGRVDDCRVYNRALTPSEIQLLYSGGRGYGLIPDRRRWFYSASSVFTGFASLTTGAATASGSATHTTPTYTGTSAVTTGAATCSGSATFTAPTFTASASVTIAAATCSATGTFVAPVYTATSVLTGGAATASGAAAFVAPVFTASASVAVGATVVNVAGSVVSPTFTGTAAVSVGAAVASGTASNNFVAGPYRVAARQVFVAGAVAFQVRTTGASAAQVF